MAKQNPVFDYELCIACGICVQTCPVSCLEMTRREEADPLRLYPEMSEEGCTGCGQCEKSCPMDAIWMEGIV